MARKRERITTPSGLTFTLEEREGDRGWQVNFQRHGRRTRFIVGRGSFEEARRRAVDEVERLLRVAASANDPSFAHVVAEMIVQKQKQQKATSYIRKIEEHFRNWVFPALGTSQPISSITAAELRDLRYQLGASDLEYRSVNRILTSVRQAFKFAEYERGYCAAPSLPRNYPEGALDDAWQVLTPAEIGVVLGKVVPDVRPLFAYIANTGLRVGSALATQAEWIDLEARTVLYPREVMKNRRAHLIELNPEAEQALREALAASPTKPFDFSILVRAEAVASRARGRGVPDAADPRPPPLLHHCAARRRGPHPHGPGHRCPSGPARDAAVRALVRRGETHGRQQGPYRSVARRAEGGFVCVGATAWHHPWHQRARGSRTGSAPRFEDAAHDVRKSEGPANLSVCGATMFELG